MVYYVSSTYCARSGDKIGKAQHLPSENILSRFCTGMPSTSQRQPNHSILHLKETHMALEQGSCRSQASGIHAWGRPKGRLQVVTRSQRVSPSEGDSCFSVAPELSSLPIFQEKPEIRIFMWNFSIFKHSAGQTKHGHWFWPLLYNRECLLLFRQN